MTEQKPPPKDSADALRALAETSAEEAQKAAQAAPQRDPHDALAAMADGQDLAPKAEEQPQEQLADEERDFVAAAAAEGQAVDPADLEGLPVGAEARAARKARAQGYDKQKSRVHALQFKKTMIPLLLVVGVMLFILGGVVAAVVLPGADDRGLFSRPFAIGAVIAAFPLGAILLFGAWFFHRETKQSQDR
jgi:hypothetical protein